MKSSEMPPNVSVNSGVSADTVVAAVKDRAAPKIPKRENLNAVLVKDMFKNLWLLPRVCVRLGAKSMELRRITANR